MDKLKPILVKIKRYHFWVVIVLIVGVAAGVWKTSVGGLQGDTKSSLSTIEGGFKKISQGSEGQVRQREHPNEFFQKGMEELIDRRKQQVLKAWRERWNQQEEILAWPKGLDDTFIQRVEKLRPIEQWIPFPTPAGQEIASRFREEYRDYIQQELPKLAEMIGSEWNAVDDDAPATEGAPSGGLFGGGAATPEPEAAQTEVDDKRIVIWSGTNQKDILQSRFDWSGQSDDGVPSTLDVLYAQEDLWVLTALCRIIKNTNDPATARHNAVIRNIDFIDIGSDVRSGAGKIQEINKNGPRKAASSGGGGGSGSPSSGSHGGGGGGPVKAGAADPGDNRYVDDEYQPLPANRLRGGSEEADLKEAYLAVARRIPIRMKLGMDLRRIKKLLVECANSPLTVEVRQLRMHPAETSAEPGAAGKKNDFPYDRNVELYGIVYIYNPVDHDRLGVEAVEPAAAEATPEDAGDTTGGDTTGDDTTGDDTTGDDTAGDDAAGETTDE